MKKIFVSAAAVIMTFVFAAGVFAQTTTPTSTVPKKMPASAKADELKARLEQKKEKIRQIVAAKVDHRLRVMLENQEKLAVRLADRIEKLAQEGVDVSVGREKLAQARKNIDEAKTALANIEKDVLAAVGASNSKTALASVKAKISKGVVEKIKSAHRLLAEAIASLKKGISKAKENRATSTGTSVDANASSSNGNL